MKKTNFQKLGKTEDFSVSFHTLFWQREYEEGGEKEEENRLKLRFSQFLFINLIRFCHKKY